MDTAKEAARIAALLEEQSYVGDETIVTSLLIAEQLRKPLLVEGPAGVGKTEIAKVLARALATDLIRLQCYEGLDASTALYERLPAGAAPARSAPVVVASRSRLSAASQRIISLLQAAYGGVELRRLSSAIKLGLIAAGEADYYPRFGPTMEWDTAAGDALLRAVGGRMLQARTGRPLRYNKHDLRNPPFIAMGAGWTLPRGWSARRAADSADTAG